MDHDEEIDPFPDDIQVKPVPLLEEEASDPPSPSEVRSRDATPVKLKKQLTVGEETQARTQSNVSTSETDEPPSPSKVKSICRSEEFLEPPSPSEVTSIDATEESLVLSPPLKVRKISMPGELWKPPSPLSTRSETNEANDNDDIIVSDNSSNEMSPSENESENEIEDLSDPEWPEVYEANSTSTTRKKEGCSKTDLIITWVAYVISTWQIMHKVSDTAINVLLHILHVFIKIISHAMGAEKDSPIDKIAVAFPNTMYKLNKQFASEDDFQKYFTCPNPSCTALYEISEVVITNNNGTTMAKSCTNKLYNRRCGTQLCKRVTINGKKIFVPLKSYVYKSIITRLEELLCRPGYLERCEEWHQRDIKNNTYADIYDGFVWKNFQSVNGSKFF